MKLLRLHSGDSPVCGCPIGYRQSGFLMFNLYTDIIRIQTILSTLDKDYLQPYNNRMKKKPGRPKKAESAKRTARTEILLTESEKRAFEKKAEKSGLTLSDWIRIRLRDAAGI